MKAFSLGIHSAIWYYISKDMQKTLSEAVGRSERIKREGE